LRRQGYSMPLIDSLKPDATREEIEIAVIQDTSAIEHQSHKVKEAARAIRREVIFESFKGERTLTVIQVLVASDTEQGFEFHYDIVEDAELVNTLANELFIKNVSNNSAKCVFKITERGKLFYTKLMATNARV
ncbi:MAG TPA: hypothetical protein PKN99_10705, partial [Cyclobacteriaceae bacterium]|nr:hypothetical protein [Cyclobacteriaceae bacterium]